MTKASSRAVVCLSASILISKACNILRNLHALWQEEADWGKQEEKELRIIFCDVVVKSQLSPVN